MKIFKSHSNWQSPLLLIVAIFLMLVTLGSILFFIFQWNHQERIFTGVKVDPYDLSRLTPMEARATLKPAIDQWFQNGFTFQAGSERVVIYPILTAPTDPDVFQELMQIDLESTLTSAMAYGRHGPWWQRINEQLTALTRGQRLNLNYQLHREQWRQVLGENLSNYESPAIEPQLSYQNEQFVLLPARPGYRFDYDRAIFDLESRVQNLNPEVIKLVALKTDPSILSETAAPLIVKANNLATQLPIILKHESQSWELTFNEVSQWLIITTDETGVASLNLNPLLFDGWLENLSTAINRPAAEAKFEIKVGRVVAFQESLAGRSIMLEDLKHTIIDTLNTLETAATPITLDIPITETAPRSNTADANNLGIESIIGVGHSNFAGSPPNRRHNIKVGADSLNGLLIKPGEEFSLIKALGDINAAAGYLPELVIKGNRTIPEFGGGLCQIGTTTFRAAMATGLPITERQNHSYNVSYYLENGLPGTDATIYGPHPDLRFKNDTPNHILIRTRISGDDLYFEFWGTNDGRVAGRTTPETWGKVSPGPTVYVETTDLPVGQKKCTEAAHAGISAKFTYTVNYADGRVNEQEFSSTYRPWQAVCLIGVEPQLEELDLSDTEVIEEPSPSPTPSPLPEPEPIPTTTAEPEPTNNHSVF